MDQPAEALGVLCAANAEHRATLPYAFARDAVVFDAVEAAWPLREAAGDAPADAPIFVIGMPRTGTTLVDHILSSHPAVESAGELQAMPLAVKKAAGTRTRTVLDPETIAAAAQTDMAAIGRDFLERASHHRRDPALRFTDKFPGNFLYAGFIARAKARGADRRACGAARWTRCSAISAICSRSARVTTTIATTSSTSLPTTSASIG